MTAREQHPPPAPARADAPEGAFKERLKSMLRRDSAAWRLCAGAQYLVRLAAARLRYGALSGGSGLEIGGPSSNFLDGVIPVYQFIGSLDGCNFSATTIWEGRIEEGLTYRYHPGREPGRQYIADATNLSEIADGAYDFVLTSHAIEHIANPVKAMKEMLRVLRPGGFLLMLLPHRDGVSEQPRRFTTMAHLAGDYERGTPEDDLSHVPELRTWLSERRDAPKEEIERYLALLENLPENRAAHLHVFNTRLGARLADYSGFRLLRVSAMPPCHIVVFASKPEDGTAPDNSDFFRGPQTYELDSPFPSDREMAGREP